jgi:hypothetical protein
MPYSMIFIEISMLVSLSSENRWNKAAAEDSWSPSGIWNSKKVDSGKGRLEYIDNRVGIDKGYPKEVESRISIY